MKSLELGLSPNGEQDNSTIRVLQANALTHSAKGKKTFSIYNHLLE